MYMWRLHENKILDINADVSVEDLPIGWKDFTQVAVMVMMKELSKGLRNHVIE